MGEVFSVLRKRKLAPQTRNGYLSVKLGAGPHFAIHRLVLLAFVGPSDLQTNHKNGRKTDNRLINLEYCTPRENNVHTIEVLGLRHGTQTRNSRFTESDVRKMRSLYASGVKQTELAVLFNTYQGVISNIISRRSRRLA
jgi:hypothetical protein